MSKPVMVIVPTLNGYALLPFNSDLLVSLKGADAEGKGVLVSNDLEGLKADIERIYTAPARARTE